jgi:hypothetical protein
MPVACAGLKQLLTVLSIFDHHIEFHLKLHPVTGSIFDNFKKWIDLRHTKTSIQNASGTTLVAPGVSQKNGYLPPGTEKIPLPAVTGRPD